MVDRNNYSPGSSCARWKMRGPYRRCESIGRASSIYSYFILAYTRTTGRQNASRKQVDGESRLECSILNSTELNGISKATVDVSRSNSAALLDFTKPRK